MDNEQKFYIGIGKKDVESREWGFGTGWGEIYKVLEKPQHPFRNRLHRVSADEFLEFLLDNYHYIENLRDMSSEDIQRIVNDDNLYQWELKEYNKKWDLYIKETYHKI